MSFFFKKNNNKKKKNKKKNKKYKKKNKKNKLIKKKIKNVNSGTFMMGIGNGNFGSNNLVFHLKNIESELNQQIVGKKSEHLYNSKNTFENIISKLKKQVQELNLKVQNYNKEKKEIINNIYRIVKILTKSLDLNKEEKVKLLEKLRSTIEKSPGFLKSINTISNNINQSLIKNKEKKSSNITMNQLLSNVNITKIATNIGETNKERHNSNPININVSQYIENNSNDKISSSIIKAPSITENVESKSINNYLPNNNNTRKQLQESNQLQSNNSSKSITELNNYYQSLKDSHNSSKSKTKELTALQNRIKRQKITLNQAKEKLDQY